MSFKSALPILSISVLAFASGCSHTVIIPPGTIVRLSRPAPGLHVAAYNRATGDYDELPGTITGLPGTFLVPPTSQPSK